VNARRAAVQSAGATPASGPVSRSGPKFLDQTAGVYVFGEAARSSYGIAWLGLYREHPRGAVAPRAASLSGVTRVPFDRNEDLTAGVRGGRPLSLVTTDLLPCSRAERVGRVVEFGRGNLGICGVSSHGLVGV
jgi:hypothetical protein